ncbi:hypothetical protein [Glaciecola sp. MF2-115]|uniref:hypothetical protein n=1 Tax=Glaciecola sp. MF2-115 TaxID=3384827 RepID=UPI0039A0E27F
MQIIKQDMRVNYHKTPALVRTVDKDFIILQLANDKSKVISVAEYFQQTQDGRITPYEPSLALTKQSVFLTSKQNEQLQKMKDYISPLLEEESPCSIRVRQRIISEVSRKRGDSGKNIPSTSTLYCWYKTFVSDKVNRNYLNLILPSNVKRGRHISTEIFDLFSSVVDEWYLKPLSEGALNKEQTYRKLKIAFSQYKSELPAFDREKAKLFSRTVFYELINELSQFEVAQEREGYSAALQRYRYTKSVYIAERPLQRVQIDAVHINIALRNENGDYVGMPVVFFAICIFTRAIVSYVISIAKKRREDLSSAIDTVKCALLPKSAPEYTENGWPLYGRIESIQFDSGIFASQTFKNFLESMQIEGIQNPPKKSWRNAFIERFNRTFREQCCRKIPGYAGKNEGRKDSTVIQMLPYTTHEEFKKIVDCFILDIYHQSPHKGLDGKSPAQVSQEYNDIVTIMPPELIASIDDFRGIKSTGTIQAHKGIEKNYHFYHSEQLREYYVAIVGSKKVNPRVTFFYSENDISKISVLNEKTGELFNVPSITLNEPISLAEDRARRKGENNFDKPIVYDSMTPIINDITSRAKTEKSENKKRRKANQQNKAKHKANLTDEALSKLLKPSPIHGKSRHVDRKPTPTKTKTEACRSRKKNVSKFDT